MYASCHAGTGGGCYTCSPRTDDTEAHITRMDYYYTAPASVLRFLMRCCVTRESTATYPVTAAVQ